MAMRRSLRAGVVPIVRATEYGTKRMTSSSANRLRNSASLLGNSSKSSATNICVPYVFFFPQQAERKLI
jgi:hypothetical protein